MNDEEEKQYVGTLLLQRGFADWFRYMFRVIEGRPFIVEKIHSTLFDVFKDIEEGKVCRQNINLPPRAGKTTLQEYFCSYVIAQNPRSNIIYTSYSQSLLGEISSKVASILEHPVFKAMYPQQFVVESEELNPIDDFWRDYLWNEGDKKKNTYSARKITTFAGGTILFASIGSQITGYGCGVRGSKKFSGFLAIDDAQKPQDSRSAILRERVVRYYEETLLSRLNNPDTPIVNIQQRLHLDDLSGVLQHKYNFATLKCPLINESGECTIPSQYTNARLKELQANNYSWSAQYQQEPIVLGGAVIKREWFKYYPLEKYHYKRLLITADTAMKVKEHNDYSVFVVGGITNDNRLHIIDVVRGKWEAPELEEVAKNLWCKYKVDVQTGVTCSGMYVEDKASGIGLLQSLKRLGIPIIPLKTDGDKLARVESVLSYLESGLVMLPVDENYSFNVDLLAECEAFTRDDSHSHDDQVDALVYNIQEGLAKTTVSVLDFFLNDSVV